MEQIKDSVATKCTILQTVKLIHLDATESLICLRVLHHMKLEHPLIEMVIQKCDYLNFPNKDIIFCWVPGHIGIRGNEKADSAAKSALDLPPVKVGVPNTDFKHHIN